MLISLLTLLNFISQTPKGYLTPGIIINIKKILGVLLLILEQPNNKGFLPKDKLNPKHMIEDIR